MFVHMHQRDQTHLMVKQLTCKTHIFMKTTSVNQALLPTCYICPKFFWPKLTHTYLQIQKEVVYCMYTLPDIKTI